MSALPPRRPDDIVLAAGLRTPFSKFGGALRAVPSVELGAESIRRLIERSDVPGERIDEVFYGVTLPAEVALDGPTSGRQALLRAGLPDSTRSLTVDRGCCSSMTAVHLAVHSLRRGDAAWVIAAGAENMGRATFLAPAGLRFGHRLGSISLRDPLDRLGADIGGRPVTVDVGEVALAWDVPRELQDDWAEGSHRRYFEAKAAGFYADHVVPVDLPEWKALLDHDELPRADCSRAKLAMLPTAYGSPTITAGNAPGLDTGAAALLLTTRTRALERGIEPLAGQRSVRGRAARHRPLARGA
jgi:acetyl-CoA C-acetyltransferase